MKDGIVNNGVEYELVVVEPIDKMYFCSQCDLKESCEDSELNDQLCTILKDWQTEEKFNRVFKEVKK